MTRLVWILGLTAALGGAGWGAQGSSPRLSDKDLERLMKNAHEDSKRFAESFRKAVGKSSVRKTTREKEARRLADRLVDQTEGMAKEFDRRKKADLTLPVVFQSAGQLEQMIRDFNLEGVVTSDFAKVRADLDQIAAQFSYTPPN